MKATPANARFHWRVISASASTGSGALPQIGFKSVPVSTADTVTVPDGYTAAPAFMYRPQDA